MTANLPHNWRPLHSPRHLPLASSGMTLPGSLAGHPLWAFRKCLLNGCFTGPVPSSCSTTGVHLLNLLSRSPPYSRPFSGPAQDCSVLLNRGGIWEGVRAQAARVTPTIRPGDSSVPTFIPTARCCWTGEGFGSGVVSSSSQGNLRNPRSLSPPPNSRRCISLEFWPEPDSSFQGPPRGGSAASPRFSETSMRF